MNNEKKKKFDAVCWKSYCSRLYCGAGHWQALGGRGWADCAQQALGERACWAYQARAAGGRERAWRAGRAGARRGGRRTGAGARARARASGSWVQAQAGGRALGVRRAGRALLRRLGWPWAVHSVHSAHFQSVLTRFFFLSHQMNTVHCKIKFF